ncbi:hypothetical protein BDZ91DRAFT_723306 [Kalaharituber pfeilii]|nr:hypothetical protein BDZ91DRAFT_723306 [Kalaharituber pfeilii]
MDSQSPVIPYRLSFIPPNVTLRRPHRPRRPLLHLSHTEFASWTPPPLCENRRPTYIGPILSLRNRIPKCQGICELTQTFDPNAHPVFLAWQQGNPVQQCCGRIPPGQGGMAAGDRRQMRRCPLILCSICVFFLGKHNGRMERMKREWRGWLEQIIEEGGRTCNLTWDNWQVRRVREYWEEQEGRREDRESE